MTTLSNPYVALRDAFKRYWRDYGGLISISTSPQFHISILVTALTYNIWVVPRWVELSTSIIPNLLGFSIGTYALFFSLLSENMRSGLQYLKDNRGTSYLDQLNSLFFHMIVVQLVALVYAIGFKSTLITDILGLVYGADVSECIVLYPRLIGSVIGCVLMIYSVLNVLGAALAIYRIASLRPN